MTYHYIAFRANTISRENENEIIKLIKKQPSTHALGSNHSSRPAERSGCLRRISYSIGRIRVPFRAAAISSVTDKHFFRVESSTVASSQGLSVVCIFIHNDSNNNNNRYTAACMYVCMYVCIIPPLLFCTSRCYVSDESIADPVLSCPVLYSPVLYCPLV